MDSSKVNPPNYRGAVGHGFCVFQIWRKYDADSSGFISAAELQVSDAGLEP